MGLFDGLGKFGSGGGGILGGAFDALHGTTPELTSTPHAPLTAPNGDIVTPMPTISATGNMTGGLLDKLREPDKRGLTFADKLFAAGGVMQGDSGGAASYLDKQRTAADALAERDKQTQLQNLSMEALRNAIGPDGQLNVRQYLNGLPAGADLAQGLKVREALRPNLTPMSRQRGGIAIFNQDTGQFMPGGIEPEARDAELINPDGTLNETVLKSQETAAERLARAKRTGAPPVGRGGGGGRRSKASGMTTQQIIDALNGG